MADHERPPACSLARRGFCGCARSSVHACAAEAMLRAQALLTCEVEIHAQRLQRGPEVPRRDERGAVTEVHLHRGETLGRISTRCSPR